MELLVTVRALIERHGLEKNYWVAYSGGMDSHVLLSLCHKLSKELPLQWRVIHINHQINAKAGEWAQHCKQVCHDLAVPYHEFCLQLNKQTGDSLEAIAREARYQQFANCMQEGDVLLTAHHQEDQAETMLLQLLRGAGLPGLAAMPMEKRFGKGLHARPLLHYSQSELSTYAETEKLKWITDGSNHDTQFSRNFLRQDIFPSLRKTWPSAAKTIARSAMHCSEAQTLLQEFAAEICVNVSGGEKNTLSVAKLLELSASKQRLILRAWIHQQGFNLPNANKLETILISVLHADWDKLPCVSWGSVELRRYRDDLFLLPSLPKHDDTAVYEWNFSQPLNLPGIGVLQAKKTLGLGLRSDLEAITVRFRQGGERATLAKRGRHTLKNLFHEWGVLPWERDRVPLIFTAERLIAAVGYYIDPEFLAGNKEEGWVVTQLP